MYGTLKEQLTRQLNELRAQGLYKAERVLTTPQSARVRVNDGPPVLNFCANNYLGLADHPAVAAAREGLEHWGYYYWHAGQGPGRGQRRLHQWPGRDRGVFAAALQRWGCSASCFVVRNLHPDGKPANWRIGVEMLYRFKTMCCHACNILDTCNLHQVRMPPVRRGCRRPLHFGP